jgi:hypothetical protein
MKLLDQFETMANLPIIEINLKDYGITSQDEYEAYYLYADEIGIHSGGITIEWDEDLSLDSHLEAIMEEIVKEIE